jgi:hypothetical protein
MTTQDDLIRQIRALERLPKVRVKQFMPTESSNLGLLGEMSYAELQERLEILKIRDAEKEDLRRQDIIASKRQKEEELKARVANIIRVRRTCWSSASCRRVAAVARWRWC